MNKCILQFWEESERGWGVRPDGCSIHLNVEHYNLYLKGIYNNRGDIVPNEYDRIVGDYIYCFLSDSLYGEILKKNSIRISEVEKNNLISNDDIIFKS